MLQHASVYAPQYWVGNLKSDDTSLTYGVIE
jgi:hypothetical protein